MRAVLLLGLIAACDSNTSSTPSPSPIATEDQQLTRSARNAARRGDCTTVVGIDVQMRKIDADFHGTVFVRDAAIARCLAHAAR
jgi:hypothetical protein